MDKIFGQLTSAPLNETGSVRLCTFSVLKTMYRKPTSQYWGNDTIECSWEVPEQSWLGEFVPTIAVKKW